MAVRSVLRRLFLLWKVLRPLLGVLRYSLEQSESPAQPFGKIRHQHKLAHQPSHKAQRHGESNLVVQYGTVVHLVEIMIVLISLEAPPPHGVLKKRWRFVTGDVGFVDLRKSELPPGPHQSVLGYKQSVELAFNGLHPVRSPCQFDVGRKQKTPVNRSMDKNAVANRKHPGRLLRRYYR